MASGVDQMCQRSGYYHVGHQFYSNLAQSSEQSQIEFIQMQQLEYEQSVLNDGRFSKVTRLQVVSQVCRPPVYSLGASLLLHAQSHSS